LAWHCTLHPAAPLHTGVPFAVGGQTMLHFPQFEFVFSAAQTPLQQSMPAAQQVLPHSTCPPPQTKQSVPEQTPVAQAIIAGAEQTPAVHVEARVFTPALQDCAGGQALPLALFEPSMHCAVPVEQEVVPWFLQGLVGVQGAPSMQVRHIPPRQNRLLPQFVPSETDVPRSLQTGAPVPQV
jgi:hypothetical protein